MYYQPNEPAPIEYTALNNRITDSHRRMTHLEKRQDDMFRDIAQIRMLVANFDKKPWWRRIFK